MFQLPYLLHKKAPHVRGLILVESMGGKDIKPFWFNFHSFLQAGNQSSILVFNTFSPEFLLKTKFIFGAKLLRGVKLTVITEPSVRAKHRHIQGFFVND
ncbi:hypothetical protein ACVXG7_02820 [Enterobacter hormaechei]